MISVTCKRCGKIIEGYNKKQVDYLMLQHELTHRDEIEAEKNKDWE